MDFDTFTQMMEIRSRLARRIHRSAGAERQALLGVLSVLDRHVKAQCDFYDYLARYRRTATRLG